MRDPAIKLFGMEITLPETGKILVGEDCGVEDGRSDGDRSSVMSSCLEDEKMDKKVKRTGDEEEEEKKVEADDDKDSQAGKPDESKQRGKSPPSETLPESEDNPKTPSLDEENASAKPQKNENDQNNANNTQQKTLKKPDKILPCPRCNSMDTKFCYYNNYNISQPRHFCKSCQRYWTAGGTMRNVPIGAGRRKNKNSSVHCRHITISEALHATANGFQNPTLKSNGTVLSFGPEAPLCESMASVLNLAEKQKAPNGIPNGFYKVEQNGDDCSSGSSVTTSNSTEEGVRNGIQEPMMGNLNGFTSQIPCLPGIPWPYWNSAAPIPAVCLSGYPMPFYATPYWTVPWLPSPSPTTNQNVPCSAPNQNSPTLGKHSREGDLIKKNSETSILIPKTIRIDDPDEAARSSIWATLGIENDSSMMSRGGLFKAFQPKGGEKNHTPETNLALWANPAALSRSLSFQERS
ncbi:unnamed protein product [Camellia sinensis]